MSWQFELVAGPFSFTEGPVWDGRALLFTDIPNSRIMRFDPKTSECGVFRTGTHKANGLTLDREGGLYACEGGESSDPKPSPGERNPKAGRCIARYHPDGSRDVIADRFEGKRLNSPNDLVFDTQGRLWFTDPRYGDFRDDMELDHESVYRCDPSIRHGAAHPKDPAESRRPTVGNGLRAVPDGSWTIRRMTFDTTRPNGLAISLDQKTLYVAQSEYGDDKKRELRAYPILGDSLGKHEVLHNFFPHRGIDGMTLDAEGNVIATAGWEVSGPGAMVYVFAPNGHVLETHPVPCQRPTNCAFGDADLQTLYVTANGGQLFAARTDRKGFLPSQYPA